MLDGDYLLIINEKQKYINTFNYVFNYAYYVIIVELEFTNPIYIYVLPIQKIYFLTFNRLLIVNFSKEKTLMIMARFYLLSIFGTLYRQAWHTSKYKNSTLYNTYYIMKPKHIVQMEKRAIMCKQLH